jgi:hypothetical protein
VSVGLAVGAFEKDVEREPADIGGLGHDGWGRVPRPMPRYWNP